MTIEDQYPGHPAHAFREPGQFADLPSEEPAPRFLEVASEIALAIGLDAALLAGGTPVQAWGRQFWFAHYGSRDPDGMTVFSKIGDGRLIRDPVPLRQLLELNAATPAGITGYFAMLPVTQELVCGWRFALDRDDAATHVLATLADACSAAASAQDAFDDTLRAMG